MKKRSYRAVEVKSVDFSRLEEEFKGQRMVFGIDIAKELQFGAIISNEEETRLIVKWRHPEETAEWVKNLVGTGARVEAVMEPSGTYGDAIRHEFNANGVKVYKVSAKRSHDAAEVLDGVPSWHDAKSAVIVGKLHMDGISTEWVARTETDRALVATTKTMAMYDGQAMQNRNRLEAQLARHWPELGGILELGSGTMLAVLGEFGGPGGVAREPERAKALMIQEGRHFLSEEKMDLTVASAKATVGVPAIREEEEAIRELALDTRRAEQKAREIRRKVAKLVEGNKSAEAMSRATGIVTAAVIVARAGDPLEFDNARAFQKSVGLNLKERSSGKHKGELKITKRGSGEVRMYLYMAALRLIQDDEVIKAYYLKKVARDGGRKKTKALVAVMRKLVLGLWHVARGNEFDARKLFDTSRLELGKVA